MGNYENLKQSITEVIGTNGNQEITGAVLQSTLLTIISTVGANATFTGIATPTTNPGTPDGPVFYLASEGGIYTNFNAIELQDGLSVLMWNGSWESQQIFSIDDEPTAGSDNLVKSGGVVEIYGKHIDNPKFVRIYTDSEDKILWGIKTDGSIYYGAGIPQQVIDYIEQKIAELPLDEYEDIVAFLNGLAEGDNTLQMLLNEKVDKEEGKSLINAEYAEGVRYTESQEFVETKLDAEDKMIEATRTDGAKVLGGSIEVGGSAKIKKGLNINETVDVYNIDNEEYLYLLLDSEDKILRCIKKDGTEYIYHIANKEFDLIKLISEESITISEGLKEKLEGIIPESVSWLGDYKQNPYYDIPDGFFDKQTIFTQNGFVIGTDLIIQTLYFYANQAGKLKFGVGTIDQRSWAIISDEFEIECVEGYNEVNIQSKCITSPRNARLFVFNDYDGKGTCIGYKKVNSLSSRCLTYAQNKSSALVYSLDGNGEELIYNSFSEVRGNIIPLLSYKLASNSLFYSTSGSLKNTRKWEEYAQNKVGYSIAQKDLIKGDDGNLYKIKVVNGSLNVEPFNISKVTVFGNSIFTHGAISSFLYPREEEGVTWNYAGEPNGGMIGMEGRGMAASQQEFDFKHLLLKGLQKLNPSVVVQGANIAGIERGRSDGTFVQGSQFGYTNLLTTDVDIIIWRAGENVSMVNESYREALRSWILYFQDRCPKALIIMTGRFWKQENCDDITAEVADEFGLPYIRMYYEDKMNIYQALNYDILQYPVTDGNTTKDVYGIAGGGGGHPGNIGMYMIADKLLKCIGVEPLNNIYDIYIDNTIGLNIVSRPKQISGAIGYIYFDENLSPTVNIVGNKTGSIVSTSILTDENLGRTTNKKFVIFTMPEEDITITIL